MADNITLDGPGAGGSTIKTDDDGTAHWQYVKVAFGADNTQSIVTSTASNPFPVALSDTDNAVLDTIDAVLDTINAKLVTGTVIGDVNLGATDNAVLDQIVTNTTGLAGTVAGSELQVDVVSGTVTANLSATDNAVLDVIAGDTTSLDSKVTACNTGAIAGTVTANLSATDNAVLDSIVTNTTGLAGTVSGSELQVDLVDGNVTNAGTFVVQEDGAALTALQLIDNSIFADDAAFTLTSSSVTVAGAIRDDSLSALSAVEGDAIPLRVNSTGALHVTGGGGGTEYEIDDAAPTTVSMCGTIRDDSLTTLTEADGDASTLRVSSTGALHVTGGGGGTEYTEDVATANPQVGTATMMERDDVLAGVTPAEGDWIGLRGTAEGALWTQDFNSDAILADTTTIASDTTSIDGKITACNTGAVVISSGSCTVDLGANNDVTVTGTVDLGATDNAVLDSIVTNTTGLAGTVSGSELQVDV